MSDRRKPKGRKYRPAENLTLALQLAILIIAVIFAFVSGRLDRLGSAQPQPVHEHAIGHTPLAGNPHRAR